MNEQLIQQLQQLGLRLGANGLPYAFPLHPNLVHFTLGLPIIAILFDGAGNLFALDKPILKYFNLPTLRSNFYLIGWYNLVVGVAISFITVAFGFFEILLAQPPTDVVSDWGLGAGTTMVLHGVGGVLILAMLVALAVWRGLMRYRWRRGHSREVQWSYLAAGLALYAVLFIHGTLGAQLGDNFGIHNTAAHLVRQGQDPNLVLQPEARSDQP
jgi:uncharacterized membrane protein